MANKKRKSYARRQTVVVKNYIERRATDTATSFLMSPSGLLITGVAFAVLFVMAWLFASWSFPIFVEQIINPVTWIIAIAIGLIANFTKKSGEISLFLSFLAGLVVWAIPTNANLTEIQTGSAWLQGIPLIGEYLYQGSITTQTSLSVPFMFWSFVMYASSIMIPTYIVTLLIRYLME